MRVGLDAQLFPISIKRIVKGYHQGVAIVEFSWIPASPKGKLTLAKAAGDNVNVGKSYARMSSDFAATFLNIVSFNGYAMMTTLAAIEVGPQGGVVHDRDGTGALIGPKVGATAAIAFDFQGGHQILLNGNTVVSPSFFSKVDTGFEIQGELLYSYALSDEKDSVRVFGGASVASDYQNVDPPSVRRGLDQGPIQFFGGTAGFQF